MIKLQRILLPTDFSGPSSEACKYACAFVDQFGAELHVLHVYEEPMPPVYLPSIASSPKEVAEFEAKAAKALEAFLDPEWKEEKKIVGAIAKGTPFVEIIRYAKEKEIDLIVVGTHGRSALSHALIGSVAEKVVRKAPCPVLTVRPGEHEFVLP